MGRETPTRKLAFFWSIFPDNFSTNINEKKGWGRRLENYFFWGNFSDKLGFSQQYGQKKRGQVLMGAPPPSLYATGMRNQIKRGNQMPNICGGGFESKILQSN